MQVTERDPAPRAVAPADRMVKFVSWNVNGLRAQGRREALAKIVEEEAPDVICLQETKLQEDHVASFSDLLPGYAQYWSCSIGKKGYAGTAVFTRAAKVGSVTTATADPTVTPAVDEPAKQKKLSAFFTKAKTDEPAANQPKLSKFFQTKTADSPATSTTFQGYSGPVVKNVIDGIGKPHDGEGRALTVEFEDFALVALYVPNSGQKLEGLDYRVQSWDPALQAHCTSLGKPVVVTGDLNVAHRDLDIYNYFAPHVPKGAGCTPQEREAFGSWLDSGFVDGESVCLSVPSSVMLLCIALLATLSSMLCDLLV